MLPLLGNSSAPRWYDDDLDRLDEYVAHVAACGATATEVVLHHGPADERTARVHVLEAEWEPVLRRYRDAELHVVCHASLAPEFSLSRWRKHRADLQVRFRQILAPVRALAADQGETVLVLHGAADAAASFAENERATIEFLGWAVEEVHGWNDPVFLAVELRATKPDRPTAAAASRSSALSIVSAVGSPRVGLCWDIAHDRENAGVEPGWELVPPEEFLARVVHIHVHDIGPSGEAHYPLVTGRVRLEEAIAGLLSRGFAVPAVTLELRWRHAERLGHPWDVLRDSYATASGELETLSADHPRSPSRTRR
jgi:sugar phosphate isomerase/epimerase